MECQHGRCDTIFGSWDVHLVLCVYDQVSNACNSLSCQLKLFSKQENPRIRNGSGALPSYEGGGIVASFLLLLAAKSWDTVDTPPPGPPIARQAPTLLSGGFPLGRCRHRFLVTQPFPEKKFAKNWFLVCSWSCSGLIAGAFWAGTGGGLAKDTWDFGFGTDIPRLGPVGVVLDSGRALGMRPSVHCLETNFDSL